MTACHLPILLLLLASATSHAAQEPKYPSVVRDFDSLRFRPVAQRELPEGVYFWRTQCAESNDDPSFQGKVASVDLNGDGTDELIVESDCKHESQYEVWQQRKGRWISLLTVLGRLDLLRKRHGYYRIAVSWEARGGERTRELYTFEGERYHATRIDKYQGDVYSGSINPRTAEHVLEQNFKEQFKRQ